MGDSITAVTKPDLNTSVKEGPDHLEAKLKLDPSSFPSILFDEDEEPNLRLAMTKRKSTAFLSSQENLSQAHPPWPSGIWMNPLRPPNPKVAASKKRPALFPPSSIEPRRQKTLTLLKNSNPSHDTPKSLMAKLKASHWRRRDQPNQRNHRLTPLREACLEELAK